MVHTIASHVPNLLPDWHFIRPAGRLFWATVLLAVSVGVIVQLCKRPKPAEPATWAQSMLGAVVTFGLMLIAYGTIPHEWLTFGNSYLHLTESKFVVHSGQHLIGPIHWLNFSINKRALLDVIAAVIYIVALSGNVMLFAKWQKRPAAKVVDAPAETQDAGTSPYGRPMTAKV